MVCLEKTIILVGIFHGQFWGTSLVTVFDSGGVPLRRTGSMFQPATRNMMLPSI